MNIRLYHPDSILENNTSLLSKEHTHYIVNVMRLKRGSNLNFFNKNGEWKSEIIFLNKDRVEVRFLEKIKEADNLSKTEIAICLVKKNPMDNILQKATELGASKIIPTFRETAQNFAGKVKFLFVSFSDNKPGFERAMHGLSLIHI